MSDELIALPRAALESLRKHLQQECEASGTIEGGCIAADALNRVEDLLAAAKPAIDAGVTQSEDEDVREDQPWCEIVMPPSEIVTVPRRGRYRWLVIAADAAEEGE